MLETRLSFLASLLMGDCAPRSGKLANRLGFSCWECRGRAIAALRSFKGGCYIPCYSRQTQAYLTLAKQILVGRQKR